MFTKFLFERIEFFFFLSSTFFCLYQDNLISAAYELSYLKVAHVEVEWKLVELHGALESDDVGALVKKRELILRLWHDRQEVRVAQGLQLGEVDEVTDGEVGRPHRVPEVPVQRQLLGREVLLVDIRGETNPKETKKNNIALIS